MDFSLRKLTLIEWLDSLQDERLIAKIEQLKNKTQVSTSLSFVPMTKEELIQRAKRAEEDIKAGRLISDEDLEKEAENW